MSLKKLCFTAALALVTAVAAAPAALAGNTHVTVGPAGYDTPGGSTLVVAGRSGTVVGPGDRVVICHATGGANGDGFVQIAPSAGTVFGHDGHEGDRDIVPPFVYEDNRGNRNSSLANGNNWTAANIEIYNNGCSAPAKQDTPPQDVCPNIQGIQTSVPSGMVKDASGQCVTPPTTVVQQTPQVVVQQTGTPATAAPAAPVVVEKVVTTTAKKAKKAKKAKRVKAKRKAKRGVKGVRAGGRKPRVLPYTR